MPLYKDLDPKPPVGSKVVFRLYDGSLMTFVTGNLVVDDDSSNPNDGGCGCCGTYFDNEEVVAVHPPLWPTDLPEDQDPPSKTSITRDHAASIGLPYTDLPCFPLIPGVGKTEKD